MNRGGGVTGGFHGSFSGGLSGGFGSEESGTDEASNEMEIHYHHTHAYQSNGLLDSFASSIDTQNNKRGLCRNGRQCKSLSHESSKCKFSHVLINKRCKFGSSCKRIGTCLFNHDGPGITRSENGNIKETKKIVNENAATGVGTIKCPGTIKCT